MRDRHRFRYFYASLCCFASHCLVGETSPDWSIRLDFNDQWPGRETSDRQWRPGQAEHDDRWPGGGPSYRPERTHNPYHPRRPLQTAIKLLHLDEGDVCRRGHRLYPDFVCAKAGDCGEPLAESVRTDNYLDLCTFDGAQAIVCCPTTAADSKTKRPPQVERSSGGNNSTTATRVGDGSAGSSVAARKCRQYSNLRLPKKNYWFIAVVGGREALSQEFPHMAVLGYGETTDLEEDWKCGGSLISERWILTAAHCRTDKSGNLARWARLGELNIGSTADSSEPEDYKIVEHVLHPDYKPSERYNDIGVFRLEKDVEFSSFRRPICLNTDPSLNPKVQIATGWGRTSTAESTSDILLKVALNVFPASRCNETYFTSDSAELRFGVQEDSMICAGSYKDDQDTCSGDSGGPLQVENAGNPGTYTQFGITSFGPAFCGVKETPGVYTKVSKYVAWIERIVWPDAS